MTNTNTNREYAVRIDYEVLEADNSINCKTAYEVFDNMQDAVNYAIDFIANNPDANIRLTNEHFNGSQISVYGDSPTKHYDLTDADINAVRNAEVNAVNAPADEITLDDILNDNEVGEHFQPVTVYVENQYGREVLVADGKVITEEEYAAMRIENCYNELRSMIKFYYKHHGLTLAQTEQIFMAIYIDEGNLDHDAIEQMIRDFKAANNPDDEPPTPPTPPTDRRAEIENAQAANVKEDTEMANINSNVTIDNGKIFDSAKVTIDQAVNIIRRLNYRNDTFQYRFTTREDHADIKYRHFDAYRDNGDKDAFAITEIVINGKLEIVRFFNLFRDIIVDLHIGNVNCKLGYKGAIEIVDEHNAQFLADKIARDAKASDDDNVFDLIPDFSRRAQIVAEHREYILDSQEDELRDAEERTIAIPIRTKIDKKGRLSVKYGDAKVTLQAAVENAIYDYRHEPITVINQYGEKFSHTAHIGQRHLGHARDILALHVRDLATLKPLPEISDEVIARRRNERIGRDLYFDKIFRESKPCDTPDEITDISRYSPTYDTRNAFDLLPALDELNDVEDGDALIDEHATPPTDDKPSRGRELAHKLTDDFNAQLAELTAAAKAAHAAEETAMRELDKACDTYHKAEETWRQARLHMRDAEIAVEQFLAGKAKELRDDLLDEDIFNANIAIIAQAGKCFDQPNLAGIWIDDTPDQKLLINSCTKFFATYDTPEQVRQAVNLLRDAINRGDSEFKFPTIGELNKPPTPSLPTFEGIAYKEKLKSGCVGWHELLIGDDDNAEYLGYADGHWTRIRSIRYGAEIYAGTDNRILFIVNQYFDDKGREHPEIAKDITDAEEFFQIMAERGICAVDELKQPPAPTFEQGKAYYQRDWTAYAAATDTKPYYIIKRTAKSVFVDTNRDSCDPFRYTIRKNDKGEYFKTYDGHAVYAIDNA